MRDATHRTQDVSDTMAGSVAYPTQPTTGKPGGLLVAGTGLQVARVGLYRWQ